MVQITGSEGKERQRGKRGKNVSAYAQEKRKKGQAGSRIPSII
jgi:hypothetical protein